MTETLILIVEDDPVQRRLLRENLAETVKGVLTHTEVPVLLIRT